MERFTIQKEYYNVLKRLRKRSERAVVALAILEFAFDEIEPKELTETAEIAFEGIRQTLEKSKNNSGRGGRKMKNRIETELKTIDNRLITETKPNCNRNETDLQPNENRIETVLNQEKNTLSLKERSKENNTLSPKKETPLYPPKGSEAQEKFFKVYCQFKKFAKGEYPQIDFTKLLDEFEKSASLRKTFSWQLILDSYDSILAGNFRDKVDAQAEGREYLAERERYYTALRAKEEAKVEAIVKKLMTLPRYAEIDKRLRSIEIDSAKAELKGDKLKLVNLEQERQRLRMERNNILANNGLEEEDITMKRRCYECNDTGWLEDGTMCSCYKGD